jgi:Domain of unknown function (DUF3943)
VIRVMREVELYQAWHNAGVHKDTFRGWSLFLRAIGFAICIVVVALHVGHAAEGLVNTSKVALDAVDDAYTWRLYDDEAYALYPGERPRRKHYVRAGIEVFALVAVGTALYWADADTNSADWDLTWDLESWRKKLITGEGLAFDINKFDTNAVSHPVAGTLYYLAARTNTLSIPASLLFAISGSTFWEFVGEFKEKVSINDLIVTPFTGMAIGEVFAQLGGFFDRGANTPLNTVLSTLFASPRRLHHWLDHTTPRRTGNVDRFGFTRDMFHQFRLWTAGGVATTLPAGHANGIFQLGLETHLVNIPGYHQPGQIARLLTDGNFSTLRVEATFGQDGLKDFRFFTKASLAGYFMQNIAHDADGRRRGYSAFIGVATAFDYAFEKRRDKQDDTVAVVHILGPSLAFSSFHGAAQVHAELDVYGNFALVHAYAVDEHIANGGTLEGAKSVLVEHHYYYAFGVTVAPRLRVSYNGWELGGAFAYDYFRSIEGADRYPERVTNDFPLTDQRATFTLWTAYILPNDHLQLALSFERYYRQGEFLEASDATRENRYMANVTLRF